MEDVDANDAVRNKSIDVLQGKIPNVRQNLVGYPRAESLAVAEVKGADLLSRVPAPHLEVGVETDIDMEVTKGYMIPQLTLKLVDILFNKIPKFGGWKKYLNFSDGLLKDTQGSLRDINAMVTDAIHTAPKVLHKWTEEPRHRTARILQVAREHFYEIERCLLYSMRMFGDDIDSLRFVSGTIFNQVVGWEVICQNGDKHSRSHVEDHMQLQGDESFSYPRPIHRVDHISRFIGHGGSLSRSAYLGIMQEFGTAMFVNL